MLSCPIESSQEWKDTLAEANGNRILALEKWQKEYGDNENLNEPAENTAEDVKEPSEKGEFSELIDSIKLFLHTKYAILSSKVVSDQVRKTKELNDLIQNFEAVEGVESINIFINDAYEKALETARVMEVTMSKIDTFTNKEAIARLTAINDYVSDYSILDEISGNDKYDYFSGEVDPSIADDDLTPQQKLSKALTIKKAIQKKYISLGIPLMADFLVAGKSETIQADINIEVEALQKRLNDVLSGNTSDKHKAERTEYYQKRIDKLQNFSLDKQSIIKILTESQKDEGVLDFLISPLISSADASLGLFAKAIKSQLELARQKDIVERDKLIIEIDKYAASTSVSIDNKAEFNEGIYEEITYSYLDKETNEIVNVSRMAFVQKYDHDKFKKAQKQFYITLGKKPIPLNPSKPTDEEKAALKKYNTDISNWYAKNRKSLTQEEKDNLKKDKIREIDNLTISQKSKDILYKEWEATVEYVADNGTVYDRGKFTRPSDEYINPKWSAMYTAEDKPKNPKGEYHKALLTKYLEDQNGLPPNQRPLYTLPSIEKTTFERDFKSTLKMNIEDAVKITARDTEFGMADLSGTGVKFLPVHYTQPMDSSQVSLDLARSVLMFGAMVNKYKALNEVNGEISLMKTIFNDTDRKTLKLNSKGEPIKNSFANKIGISKYIADEGNSYSAKHLNAFIDMVVYGEMQKAEELFGLSTTKIVNSLTGFSAITTIALDALKGFANNFQGNIQMAIEANSGQFFSKSDLALAKSLYLRSIPTILADFGKRAPESFIGQLVEHMDALQGEFVDQYGKKITSSMAIKLMSSDTLFFNQHFGEHEIQVSGMLALMNATKIIDNATGATITLLEGYKKYGVKGSAITENTNFTEKQRQDFQNRLHALNKRMHGVYNSFDRSTSQRHTLGRLAIMYRKHLVPGYKRRFKSLSDDQELGTFTEGYYKTFWDTFLKDAITFKWKNIQNWSTYSPFEKAQTKRTVAELSIILTTTALVAILTSMGDDDDELKDNYAYNFALYEMIRMRSETSAYANPIDMYRVVKSPSAMTGTLERAIRFTDQFFLTWDPEKLTYHRKQGTWKEGDNKSWAYFLKLMGYSGNNIAPEAAVEAFKGIVH